MRIKSIKRQRGAEIVEFIIVLPFILVVFFLIVDLGIFAINQSVLVTASREAARELIRSSASSDDERCGHAKDAVMRVTSGGSLIALDTSDREKLEAIANIDCSVGGCDNDSDPGDGNLRVCIELEAPQDGGRNIVTVSVTYGNSLQLLPDFLSRIFDFSDVTSRRPSAVTTMRMLTQLE